VSIIIPARNEEGNIAGLLESINRQEHPPREVIVVDDYSDDATVDIARNLGAKIIRPPALPAGWRGKTWACQQGARTAEGEALVFMDADTTLLPNALARICALFFENRIGALSLGPYHCVKRLHEQFSLLFNLLTFIGVGSFSAWGSPAKPRGLFGPFLMIDRNVYNSIGGHGAVKGEILENMALTRILQKHNVEMLCLGGRGVINIRMYPEGIHALAEGWTKAFAAGSSMTTPATMLLSIFWLSGAVLAFAVAVAALFTGLDALTAGLMYFAYAVAFYWMARGIGSFSIWTALLYPLPLIFFFLVFVRSAILNCTHKTVIWRGRKIQS